MDTAVSSEAEQTLRVYRALYDLTRERGTAEFAEVKTRTGLSDEAVDRAYKIILRVLKEDG